MGQIGDFGQKTGVRIAKTAKSPVFELT